MEELLAAYEGLEQPASFAGAEAIASYRESMLKRSDPQADRIEQLGGAGRVLEVACGNGRLLVELARRGRVESGLGIDIAPSRIDFARNWAAEDGHDQLEFEADDIFAVDVPAATFDLAICITGAFAYFEPVRPGSGRELLERMRAAMRPGALLVLELYQHPTELRLLEAAGEELRQWRELAPEDPWRFYLSRFELNDDSVLTHEKTFLHRQTGEVDEGRRERLRIYRPEDLVELLGSSGFEDVELWDGWGEDAYAGGDVLVVTARAA
jgi:SAM-dependent methyltransferase